jgi:hypothetical protein
MARIGAGERACTGLNWLSCHPTPRHICGLSALRCQRGSSVFTLMPKGAQFPGRQWLVADNAYAMSVAVVLPLLGLILRYEGELYPPQFNEPD